MDLADLTRATFDELLGSDFTVRVGNDAVSVRLAEVSGLPKHPHHEREPFSLVFETPADTPLGQGTYRLEHEKLGTVEIFMVPIGANEQGGRLEAIFN